MKILKTLFCLLITVLMLWGCESASQKKDKSKLQKKNAHSITIADGWARPGSKGGNSAAYLNIYNGTDSTDTLLNVSTDASKKAAIHESYEKKGMVGMRPAGQQIIQPDSSLVLKPGGFHLMLMNLNKDLSTQDSVNITFTFARSGKQRTSVHIQLQQ